MFFRYGRSLHSIHSIEEFLMPGLTPFLPTAHLPHDIFGQFSSMRRMSSTGPFYSRQSDHRLSFERVSGEAGKPAAR